jgi:uncharacterized protein (TIGR03435 family)
MTPMARRTLLLGLVCRGAEFAVASVKVSGQRAGPDSNNQLVYTAAGLTARNATLRRLTAEAFRVQMNQVLGPGWMDVEEYDLSARTEGPATREEMAGMLRTLLAERFQLREHGETRQMRAYELVTGKGGFRVRTAEEGMAFRGDMRALADMIAVQLSIAVSNDPTQPGRAAGPPAPVLDKTGLSEVYELRLDIRPEPGGDMFSVWQRVLENQFGLRLENRRGAVPVIVVDGAARVPGAN